jgi:hypothetical protein
MSASLISSLASSGQAFAIKNQQTGATVIPGVVPIRVHIKLTSTPMRHMKEDGTTIVDARIIQPTTVNVDAYCPDISTFSAISTVGKDRSSFYSIRSKGIVINQLMGNTRQFKQSPDVLSAMPMRLSFQQVITKNSKPVVVAVPTNSSLISLGMNILSTASSAVTGLVAKVSKVF